MALYGAHKDRGELRIHENLDELRTDLADCIAEISEILVKERGVFTIALSAEQAANDYEFVIRQLVKTRVSSVSKTSDCPKFDLVLPGMGHDGHVASLFPNHPVLNEKDEWVTFITDSPEPPPERITFTIPVINSASDVAVVATGIGKAEAVHLVINDVGTDCPSLPVRMIQPTKGKLVWFLDKTAASKLDGAQFSEYGQALLVKAHTCAY